MSGESIPDVLTAAAVARFFRVSVDYLSGNSDVRSTDTNLKAICDYTGLSEKSIMLCSKLREYKHSLIYWYRTQLTRINIGIGHLKLSEIRPQHLNAFYTQLSGKGVRADGTKASTTSDLYAHIIKEADKRSADCIANIVLRKKA